jgi:hypothetical protein
MNVLVLLRVYACILMRVYICVCVKHHAFVRVSFLVCFYSSGMVSFVDETVANLTAALKVLLDCICA